LLHRLQEAEARIVESLMALETTAFTSNTGITAAQMTSQLSNGVTVFLPRTLVLYLQGKI